MKLTNCINCGAPLHGLVCAYCGTDYGEKGTPLRIDVNGERFRGNMNLMGTDYDVYVEDVVIEHDGFDSYRTWDGRILAISPSRPHIRCTIVGTPKDD